MLQRLLLPLRRSPSPEVEFVGECIDTESEARVKTESTKFTKTKKKNRHCVTTLKRNDKKIQTRSIWDVERKLRESIEERSM